jgi:RNA-binding protein YhbY
MNVQEENAVTVQLGKKGLSETFSLEIMKNLNQNRLVKVKILKNALESTDKHTYSDSIVAEIEKKVKVEHKLIGKTLFLKKINNNQTAKTEISSEFE